MSANDEDRPENKNVVSYFGDGEQTASQDPDSWASFPSGIDSRAVSGSGTAEGGKMRQTQPFGSEAGIGDTGDGNQPGLGDSDDDSADGGSDDNGSEGEYVQDQDGNPGISKIDETNLKQIDRKSVV